MAEHPPVNVQVTPQQPPPGYVMISPKDMYDDIQAIKNAVTGIPGRVAKLETQVDNLKARVLFMSGAAAALGTGLGALGVKLGGG